MGRFQTVRSARERRRGRRYEVQVNALITTDDQAAVHNCMIHDISQTGALIEIESGEMPDDFTLTFSRRCRVVRRGQNAGKIGVEFLLPWSVLPQEKAQGGA